MPVTKCLFERIADRRVRGITPSSPRLPVPTATLLPDGVTGIGTGMSLPLPLLLVLPSAFPPWVVVAAVAAADAMRVLLRVPRAGVLIVPVVLSIALSLLLPLTVNREDEDEEDRVLGLVVVVVLLRVPAPKVVAVGEDANDEPDDNDVSGASPLFK